MADVREFSDWIDAFLEYTANIRSARQYREWTAYSCLAGAVERRIWTILSGKTCYPNLFLLFVGVPASGKTVSVDEAIELWAETKKVRLAPSGMTKAAFIDHMNEQTQTLTYNGHSHFYHSLCMASGEFGILLPDYDVPFLNVLNDLYDCRPLFEDRTRKDGLKIVERPQINFIAGTQAPYLGHILPDTAFGMGFTSRIIMIYCGEAVKKPLYLPDIKPEHMKAKLVKDLQTIQSIVGPMTPTREAVEYIESWYKDEADDEAPDHPLLRNYCGRRHIHVQKLAMLSALSRSNDLLLEVKDYERARNLLVETESTMPEIFKEMTTSQDAKEIDEIFAFVLTYCHKTEEAGIPESELYNFISQRMPVNKVDFMLETLIKTQKIKLVGLNIPGQRRFKPGEVNLLN